MIRVICNQETFVYNAYHMVKAFYPQETVSSSVDEKASNYVTVEFVQKNSTMDHEEEGVLKIEWKVSVGVEDSGETQYFLADKMIEKSVLKKRIDRTLYQKLAEQSGKKLAWGMLMGVRPTKIAMKKLEEFVEFSNKR